MIKEAIEFIVQKLTDTNLFEKVYSQVELVTNSDNKTIPAIYISNGKYKPIEYSANNGTAYFRKNGKITIVETESQNYVGCESFYQITIPLKLVVYKKKNKLPIDCSYTEDLLAETIIAYLSNNLVGWKGTINAQRFSIEFTSIDTDSLAVWNEETNNVEQGDINYDIACVSFEVSLIIIANKKCLTDMCNIEN